MRANLFLHPDTFIYNKTDTWQQIAEKLSALVTDMRMIITDFKEENSFKVPTSLCSIPLFSGKTIIEMAEDCLENDQKGIFYTMLSDTSESYDIPLDELKNKCKYDPNETEVNSIVEFNASNKKTDNEYISFDNYTVVYNKQTWMCLRRQILGNHPGTPNSFIEECRKYFPKIAFHSNCIKSLEDEDYKYLEIVPRKLVYYLSCLNDKFHEIVKPHANANDVLEEFSGKYGLDESGSLERNPSKKSKLSFDFLDKKNNTKEICCEPHLKISQPDSNYQGENVNYSTFHPRIYFHFGSPDIEDGKILVGSIGEHL